MANIHTQIKDGKLDVMHQGESKVFALPEWMKALGLPDTLQDADKMIALLSEHDVLLGFLHAGLKECFVGLRAHIRPKDGVSIDSDTAGDPMTYKPKAQDVPGTKTVKAITPEQALAVLMKDMSQEDIMKKIAEMQGK